MGKTGQSNKAERQRNREEEKRRAKNEKKKFEAKMRRDQAAARALKERYGEKIPLFSKHGMTVFAPSIDQLKKEFENFPFQESWSFGRMKISSRDGSIMDISAYRRRRWSGNYFFFILHKDRDKLNKWLHQNGKHVKEVRFISNALAHENALPIDISALSKKSILLLADSNYALMPLFYKHCLVNIEGFSLEVLLGLNGQYYIRRSTWKSMPSFVKEHFIGGKETRQFSLDRQASDERLSEQKTQKECFLVRISDPNCIRVNIKDNSIRSICSQLAQFTDGTNSWTVPCKINPQADGIQVPVELFLERVPQMTIKQLIQNNRLSDQQKLLPKSFFQKDPSNVQIKEEQPSIEAVPDSVAASYFSEAFISQAEQQAPAMWKLWQKSRQIFVFEEELCSSLLLNVNSIKTVRCETIRSIPYAAGYIVGGASGLEFFASMAGTALQLQRMQGDQVAEAYTLELTKGCTVQECIPAILDKTKMARLLEMLQLYACLCVAEAAATEPSPVATQGTAKQQKQGKAPAAAPDPAPAWDSIYTVTMRRTPPTGKSREEAATEGPARRPHTRRAHWHNYWKGAKSEPESRWLERKWVAEIAVNAAQKELPVRIVLIKQSNYLNLIQNKNQRG